MTETDDIYQGKKERKPAGALRLLHLDESFDAPLPKEVQRAFEGRGR